MAPADLMRPRLSGRGGHSPLARRRGFLGGAKREARIAMAGAKQAESKKRIPKAVVKRLSLYSRALHDLDEHNVTKISSRGLSELVGVNPAKVRKDLAYFGQFGVPGLGYYVCDLRRELKRILQTDREIRVALFGAGNLGQALLSYGGFAKHGFSLVCAFDISPQIVGKTINGVTIEAVAHASERLREQNIHIAVLAMGAETCQATVDTIARAGIRAILNFVPKRLVTPPEIKVHYVDLAVELESLSYHLGEE